MAILKTALLRKLKKILTQRFPAPAIVRLEEHEGIVGIIITEEFYRMETMDRQKLIRTTVETQLTKDERRQILVIVGVTPDEETGYLAGVDS